MKDDLNKDMENLRKENPGSEKFFNQKKKKKRRRNGESHSSRLQWKTES
jgi:hypothetical protein